ncbi:MAG: hypothetical protein KGQ58_02950 [Proteobacteria bacterium]|nr:hypothetical protein [Pseudomonadota bacterium]MDE3207559.1 hypothetical protein [Pseudomonadota bacterium]
MMDCHKATRLISRSREIRLSLLKRFSLLLHLKTCDPCSHFLRHLALFSRAAKATTPSDKNLDEATKSRILSNLSQHTPTPRTPS